MDISIDQAIDITNGTLQDVRKNSIPMTYLYSTYSFFNTFWKSRQMKEGGKWIERYITLGDEGNAAHKNKWADDTHYVKNITKAYTVKWRFAKSNFSYNWPEMDLNNGAAQIYDVLKLKYNNCLRELVDNIYQAIFSTPTSSSDENSVLGLPWWLSFGTDDSTGGWTAYDGHYNDGSATAAEKVSEITCDASTNPRWASYFADHNGDLDDSLLVLLDRATRKLHFTGPTVPETLPGPSNSKFSLYSNDNVIGTVNLMYAKADDQMGIRIGSHFGTPTFKGMPFEYVDILDTADTDTYKTDPIFGVNHELVYPVVHSGWDFKVSKPSPRDDNHLVLSTYVDLQYAIVGENLRHAGFLVAQI